MNENSPIVRHWNMLTLVAQKPEGIAIDDIAKHLNVSTRTTHRDLVDLKKLGIPIVEDVEKFGKKFWKFRADARPHQRTKALTFDEIFAISLGSRFLDQLEGTRIGDSIRTALEKIRQSIGIRALVYFSPLLDRVQTTELGKSDYSRKGSIIDTIISGIEKEHSIRIRYQSLKVDQPEVYVIHPYQVVFHRGTLYVIGYSLKSKGFRTLKMDRIEAAVPLEETFKRDPNFSEEEYRNRMFGIYPAPENRSNPKKVMIRFDRHVARYVREHFWNRTETYTKESDGSLVLKMKIDLTPELKSWVLSFGSHAEVLSPKAFRQEIAQEIETMLKAY